MQLKPRGLHDDLLDELRQEVAPAVIVQLAEAGAEQPRMGQDGPLLSCAFVPGSFAGVPGQRSVASASPSPSASDAAH